MDLSADDHRVVYAVLEHLYGMEYSIPSDCEDHATFHVAVYAAGEFYQLADLKTLAGHNLLAVLSKSANGADRCLTAAEVAYTDPASDCGLRDIIAGSIMWNDKILARRDTEALLLRIPQLVVDVLRGQSGISTYAMKRHTVRHGAMCSECDIIFQVRSTGDLPSADSTGFPRMCPSCGSGGAVEPVPDSLFD